MGSRCTSLIAVILSLIILIIAAILFFIGLTNFKPESLDDISGIKESKITASKLPIIDVEEFLQKNEKHKASISFINGTKISKGTLYTYPKCFYIEKSVKELSSISDLKSYKPSIELGQSIKFDILPSPKATETIDFCGNHKKLMLTQYTVLGTGILSVTIQIIIAVLTILIIFGCCKYSNLPLVVAVVGLFGFLCAVTALGGFMCFTMKYYTMRGFESKEVALDYGFPDQGNNMYYVGACSCILASNLIFVVMMFVACGQRKNEIILDAVTTSRK